MIWVTSKRLLLGILKSRTLSGQRDMKRNKFKRNSEDQISDDELYDDALGKASADCYERSRKTRIKVQRLDIWIDVGDNDPESKTELICD